MLSSTIVLGGFVDFIPVYFGGVDRYCLSPGGFAPWSYRFFESIAAGCIPVLFDDESSRVRLPFEDLIDYSRFVVRIPSVCNAVIGINSLLYHHHGVLISRKSPMIFINIIIVMSH